MRLPRKTLPLLLSATLMLAFATTASADSIQIQIGVPNAALSPYPGPYATLDVNRTTNTTATLTFTGLTSGIYSYLMGSQDVVAVNVNATTWTVSGIAATVAPGFSNGAVTDEGAGNVSTFGSLNQTFSAFDGYTNSKTTVSFILTNTSGTWATAASVLTPNASGYSAAAHIFVAGTPPNATAPAFVTGFAANGSTSVPDGGMTVSLLGMAMAGLGLVARRMKK